MSRNIPKSLKSVAFCTAIRHGGKESHEFLEKLLHDRLSKPSHKVDVMKGLLCSKDRWRLNKYFNNEFDKNADLLKTIAVGTNSNGNFIIWDFIKNNWQMLSDANEEINMIGLVYEVVKQFNTEEQYKDFYRFYNEKKIDLKDERSLKMLYSSANFIKSNIKWVNIMRNDVESFFGNIDVQGNFQWN